MIYLLVMNRPGLSVTSPLDRIRTAIGKRGDGCFFAIDYSERGAFGHILVGWHSRRERAMGEREDSSCEAYIGWDAGRAETSVDNGRLKSAGQTGQPTSPINPVAHAIRGDTAVPLEFRVSENR